MQVKLYSTVGPQTLRTKIQVDVNTDPPLVKEDSVRELLQELDPYKSVGADNIHPRVLADIIAKLLFIIFEKSWRLRDIPKIWKKANATPVYKKSSKDYPGNHRPISLSSVSGEVMERILVGTITSQMKHVTGKSQHELTKSKSCLLELITFHHNVTRSVKVGQAADFSKAFATFSHSLLLKKLMHYGLDQWSVQWVRN